MLATRWFLSL